ncbi:50S ribosomal protein L20 [Labeo rohita]|uniref:50S ribosomal protein L20 n=1 Tax=Labeo rohita TaxID=84645 RepID=A0ABQ8LAZ0_LABRO|nr:50S ribosomal protein L20 [Labeo rohita]
MANDNGMAGGTHTANNTGTARGIRMANDNGTTGGTPDTGLEKRLRARNGINQEVSEKSVEQKYLKEATVIVNVENVIEVRAEDIIKAVTEQCGHGKILALRPRQGKEYKLTMENEETCDKLIDGLRIKGVDFKRRRYPGTDIEDGTRYLKVRFLKEVASLPYSTRLETAEGLQYFWVMDSHQVKTCRLCMSPDHLLREFY